MALRAWKIHNIAAFDIILKMKAPNSCCRYIGCTSMMSTSWSLRSCVGLNTKCTISAKFAKSVHAKVMLTVLFESGFWWATGCHHAECQRAVQPKKQSVALKNQKGNVFDYKSNRKM